MNKGDKQFDVALSFAGEDRKYVEQVAGILRKMGIRVFYDKYVKVTLWGKDLYEHLIDVYQKKARYTVMFCSENYANKLWTNLERKAAQAKAFESSHEYILPARFDDTAIPGLLPTICYIDLREYRPKEFAELIKEKIGPLERMEYFPNEPDYLHEEVGAQTPRQKKEINFLAYQFFEALKLMTPEERRLLITLIENTCPAGPPENVHQKIDLLGRLVGLSPKELISRFARLDCLGIKTTIEKDVRHLKLACEDEDIIRVEFEADLKRTINATFLAHAIIQVLGSKLCPECRKKAIDRLDFSFLSSLEGFPEKKHLNKKKNSMQTKTKCAQCNGTGKCAECKGKGKKFHGRFHGELTCSRCKGSGKCRNCKGIGYVWVAN